MYRRIVQKFLFVSFFILLASQNSFAEIRLPHLLSDGMVLQRNIPLKIWGWGKTGEQVIISFKEYSDTTITDEKGYWNFLMPAQSAGGPFTMYLSGENLITLENILVGEVWVCSGQSNMTITLQRVEPLYPNEIAQSANPEIRYFSVPQKYDFKEPREDLEYGNWQMITPQTAPQIAAVPYFYAKELYRKYGIPIGIINSSLGGSPIESWMSEEAIKSFSEPYAEGLKFRDNSYIDSIQKSDRERINRWYEESWMKDKGSQNKDMSWHSPWLDDSSWKTMHVPSSWNNTELEGVNGVVWFRTRVKIPEELEGKKVPINLGVIVDADSVFVNGKYVGTTSYRYPPRRYQIPAGVLVKGENTIAVRVIINNKGTGAFVPDKPYEIIGDNNKIELKGDWKYKVGCTMPPCEPQTFIRWKPMGLYNAMLAPLVSYQIKGILWYQGESNTGDPDTYADLFSAMVNDWRSKWDLGDIPFIYVQLPNFMETVNQPGESGWAAFRQMQLEALQIPNTAMAVTIDLGEWNDIHPLNKEDVGKRLALAAQKLAYNEDIVFSGPLYRDMRIEEGKIILSFSNIGSGLVSIDGGALSQFAIAGEEGEYVWAKAKIEGNEVVVWNEAVKNPVVVRYAWANNPEGANLYNKEGLPASPFTTEK